MANVMDAISAALGGAASALGGDSFALPGGALNFDVTPGFSIGPQGASGLYEPYVPTGTGHRAHRFIGINPTSGAATWFGPLGRPILFSGDFAAVRRVRRVAGRARRRVGGR